MFVYGEILVFLEIPLMIYTVMILTVEAHEIVQTILQFIPLGKGNNSCQYRSFAIMAVDHIGGGACSANTVQPRPSQYQKKKWQKQQQHQITRRKVAIPTTHITDIIRLRRCQDTFLPVENVPLITRIL